MARLNPHKLHVTYLTGTSPDTLVLPRRYTLTHSDITGNLFLSIGTQFNIKQTSNLYTRLMRDEVLAELIDEGSHPVLKVYCYVSGGLVLGTAKWRYGIFQSELPLALEAIRHGDNHLFEANPTLDHTAIYIHFQSSNELFNKVEYWGIMSKYRYQ